LICVEQYLKRQDYAVNSSANLKLHKRRLFKDPSFAFKILPGKVILNAFSIKVQEVLFFSQNIRVNPLTPDS
jgi:hypothetical protein